MGTLSKFWVVLLQIFVVSLFVCISGVLRKIAECC